MFMPGAPSSHDQAISYGRFVDDERRPHRVALELLAQASHRDAQIVDMILLRRSPHRSQQVGVGENAAGVLGELGEHRIFLGRQMHRFAVALDAAAVQIDRERTDD